jgi:hypothetical protein
MHTGDASVTVGHVVIAVMLGALATGILAVAFMLLNAIIEIIQGTIRLMKKE